MNLRTLLPIFFLLIFSASEASARADSSATLLEYIAGRDDIPSSEHSTWKKAIKLKFGGKAMNDGKDEGVIAAKSVLSAAIFFSIPAKQAAEAAFAAYYDVSRWVPTPIAVNYQLLAFQGRKPPASPRAMAFNFPRYFSEEIAPDLVLWWDTQLNDGKINPLEEKDVRTALNETRKMMQPMLVEMLWQAASLEGRLQSLNPISNAHAEIKKEMAQIQKELETTYKKVSLQKKVYKQNTPFYKRYLIASKEAGMKAKARPGFGKAAWTPPPPPPQYPFKIQKHEPTKKPELRPKSGQTQTPKTQTSQKTRKGSAQRRGSIAAPLPGDPLLKTEKSWPQSLSKSADRWKGTRYLFGGTTRKGVDCSAYMRAIFREGLDVELPRNSRAQHRLGRSVGQKQLKPGDLIFFDTLDRGRVTHVGVYLGKGEFSHASSSKGVTRAKLKYRYYQRAYVGSRRVIKP